MLHKPTGVAVAILRASATLEALLSMMKVG
jgi:hypothetical protein